LSALRKLNKISYDEDKVPQGTQIKVAVAGALARKSFSEPVKLDAPRIVKHVVGQNETFAQISNDYDIPQEELLALNGMDNGRVFKGKILKIKTYLFERGHSEPDLAVQNPAKVIKRQTPTENTKRKIPVNNNSSNDLTQNNQAAKKKITHKVNSGETLSSIAEKYGVKESDLKKWNPSKILGANSIYAGTKLKIYPGKSGVSENSKINEKPDDIKTSKNTSGQKKTTDKKSASTKEKEAKEKAEKLKEAKEKADKEAKEKEAKEKSANEKKAKPKYYVVKKGDNLTEIAKKYGVSLSSLQELNKKIDPDKIKAGKKIRIK
jgi:LysM repeat protein